MLSSVCPGGVWYSKDPTKKEVLKQWKHKWREKESSYWVHIALTSEKYNVIFWWIDPSFCTCLSVTWNIIFSENSRSMLPWWFGRGKRWTSGAGSENTPIQLLGWASELVERFAKRTESPQLESRRSQNVKHWAAMFRFSVQTSFFFPPTPFAHFHVPKATTLCNKMDKDPFLGVSGEMLSVRLLRSELLPEAARTALLATLKNIWRTITQPPKSESTHLQPEHTNSCVLTRKEDLVDIEINTNFSMTFILHLKIFQNNKNNNCFQFFLWKNQNMLDVFLKSQYVRQQTHTLCLFVPTAVLWLWWSSATFSPIVNAVLQFAEAVADARVLELFSSSTWPSDFWGQNKGDHVGTEDGWRTIADNLCSLIK